MKKLIFIAILLAPTLALAQLEWRVSVKFILDAGNQRPAVGDFITDQQVRDTIQRANDILAASARGYGYRLIEITNVVGISQWFDSDRTNSAAIEAAAEANKPLYLYRDNAINVYINGWGGTAVCSLPNDPDSQNDIIFMGQGSLPTTFAHEGGHYFDLYHTFDGETFRNVDNTPCSTNNCTCALSVGGNSDLMVDTLSDHECWSTQNQIAGGNFGVNYGSPGSDDAAVDRTYFNVMSYRASARRRFTDDQMDRATDTSNGVRLKVATGRTRFVATWGDDSGNNPGTSSASRLRNVSTAVARANAGDIVLIAGGTYNEPRTINKAVTLRATRGDVTIGAP